MILLGDLKRMAAGRLSAPCMLRVCREDGWLLVTDWPRRFPDQAGRTESLLSGDGWVAAPFQGLWRLDPGPALWASVIRSVPREELPDPADVSLPLYSIARRLTALSVPDELQSVLPMRVMLKAMDAGDAGAVIRFFPPYLSALLRQKKPLPEAAGRALVWAMNRHIF